MRGSHAQVVPSFFLISFYSSLFPLISSQSCLFLVLALSEYPHFRELLTAMAKCRLVYRGFGFRPEQSIVLLRGGINMKL